MIWLRVWMLRLVALFRRRRLEEQLSEDLRTHIEMLATENLAKGMSPEEARYAAERAFGNMAQIKEDAHDIWVWRSIETLLQDLRYGLRQLRRYPAFTCVAIATLALGIGANTAIFSVIDAVLLNPLPYPNASRLVMIWEQNPERGWFHNIVSAADFVDWRKQNHVFTQMAAIEDVSYDINGTGEPMEVQGEQVSADFFTVLGVRPLLGRTFTREEDQPRSARVVVLSDQI